MDPAILLWVVAAALVVGGLAGLVLPVLPGAALLLAGLVMAAWIEDFRYAGVGTLSVLVLLAGMVIAVDFAAGAFGAKRFGASPRAAAGAVLGALVGVFFGIPGVVLGPLAGAVAGELSARRTWSEAGRAGMGVTIGLVLGAAVKFALAIAMLGIYLFMRLAG
ncbi:MAG TPA: DUF456 family protein [Pseudomonadales bacterium]|nr:DUF456 family protein [Pseudomonadales bacterium]HND13375.1 DUF456 family protein [Pseudomonadales bacterium]